MVTDGHNDPHDSSNDHLDDDGNDSDGHDSLRSLFSPPELDRDSTDTELNLEAEPKELHKQLQEDTAQVAEILKTGNRAGGNSIALHVLIGRILTSFRWADYSGRRRIRRGPR